MSDNDSPDPDKKANDLVSIIIVTYNHRQYLEKCLTSIQKQKHPHEIILVDNCSQDGTPDYVRHAFPEVTIIESQENNGYGAGNNRGFMSAKGNYIVILNPDVIVGEEWLSRLISPLINQDHIITTPKILMYDGSKINTIGNSNHFTGLTFTNGLGEGPSSFTNTTKVSGVSGACFALTKEAYRELGGFDESFFLYNEDSDFSWRANSMGYAIVAVPDSILYHDYQLKVNPEKIYFLEKGRYIILRKYLTTGDFVWLSPSLLIAEVLTWGYASKFGIQGLHLKMKAIRDGLSVDVKKCKNDSRNVFRHLTTTIPVEQLSFSRVDKTVKIIANTIFALNMRLFP